MGQIGKELKNIALHIKGGYNKKQKVFGVEKAFMYKKERKNVYGTNHLSW